MKEAARLAAEAAAAAKARRVKSRAFGSWGELWDFPYAQNRAPQTVARCSKTSHERVVGLSEKGG